MPEYRNLIDTYRKRRYDTLVDSVTSGLSFADDIALDMGLMDSAGIIDDIIGTASIIMPLALILISERIKVLKGRKTARAGRGDTVFRIIKTCAAMGIGTAVITSGAAAAVALPASIGTRLILDRYRSRMLTGCRVSERTQRLRSIRERLTDRGNMFIGSTALT